MEADISSTFYSFDIIWPQMGSQAERASHREDSIHGAAYLFALLICFTSQGTSYN